MGRKWKTDRHLQEKTKKGKYVIYVPDTERDRSNRELGRRLDKFLVSEDLNIKETEVKHIPDHFYKQ